MQKDEKMTVAEKKRYKARQLRYKRPMAKDLNLGKIQSELWDMIDACSNIHWCFNDGESIVNALDGDEDEAYEFKLAFSDLDIELQEFQNDLECEYVTEYFDVFFPAIGAGEDGYLGYDSYERDYYGIMPYEYGFAEKEAAKKIMKLTKKEMLEVAGQCLKIARSYIALRYRYDCLESAIEILRGENMERLKIVKGIEEQYNLAEEKSKGFELLWHADVAKLDYMLRDVPQEYWIQ